MKRKTIIVAMIAANCTIWAYFWTSFFIVAEPFDPRPGGLHAPVNPMVVGGYSIGLIQLLGDYAFVNITSILQLPSLLIAAFLRYAIVDYITREQVFWGLNIVGIVYILTMIISFIQWYLLAILINWIVLRFSSKKATA